MLLLLLQQVFIYVRAFVQVYRFVQVCVHECMFLLMLHCLACCCRRCRSYVCLLTDMQA